MAAGRFDGFWELKLGAWDVAAAGLIAEQAGARVTDLKGEPNYLAAPISILAAAPGVYDQMVAVLNQS